jgi:hypothetical protein
MRVTSATNPHTCSGAAATVRSTSTEREESTWLAMTEKPSPERPDAELSRVFASVDQMRRHGNPPAR